MTLVSDQCFYQLRQLRSVRQSRLDTESITTLIHAFVSSRVDYCCSLLIGSPRSVTDKLQRVLNAAARVITNKHQEVWKRVITDTALRPSLAGCYWTYSVPSGCNSIYQCLHSMAPAYLTELCTPVTASASRRGGLRSVTLTSNLVVPRCRLSTYGYGTRAFSVAGPVCWYALPDYLTLSDLSFDVFKYQLKPTAWGLKLWL